ncbi:MAG: prepilin peptidase [Bacillota bacterium]
MTLVYSILIFILGSLLASFFQLVALRVPNKESISGRSFCLQCHQQLRWIDILPIFGYLVNLGQCHNCKQPIPISHLIIEILGGALFVSAYLMVGFELELIVAFIMISVLLIESISDGAYLIVIDRIWIIGIIPLIIIRIIQGSFMKYGLSSLVLFGILYLFAFIGKKMYHREAFGGGDVKIYLFIGLCLTYQLGILSLFLASLFGLIFGLIRKQKANAEIALVPFIFAGVWISYFYGTMIMNWYLNLLGV